MWRRFFLIVGFFFLFAARAGEASPLLRVGVVNGQRSALFVARGGPLSLRRAGDVRIWAEGERHFITAEAGTLKIDGQPADAGSLSVSPAGPESRAEVNRRLYRGVFSVSLRAGGEALDVVNNLPLEEYLYSVVGGAVQPLWPPEAVKAQAVVSRTLALYALDGGAERICDLSATDGNIYNGLQAERPEINTLIADTAGEALTWQDRPLSALFHASSGGRTDSLPGWPYLRAVSDFDQDCPNFVWQKTYTAKMIDARLRYAGYGRIGRLRGFEFSPLTEGGAASDRQASGRLIQLKVLGERGFAVIAGERFARLLALPSGAFDLTISNLLPREIDVPITDPYGNVIGVKKIPVTVNADPVFPADRPLVQRVTWAGNEKIVIRGRGEGNGLGYSQWGGRGLAVSGWDYQAIARYYFAGAKLRKLY
jgi:stage II sporulation protein D